MEEVAVLKKKDFCFACLAVGKEKHLRNYVVSNDSLKILLKDTCITLCSLCTIIAQRLDYFVQNVQKSQKLLENLSLINQPMLTTIATEMRPLVNLTCQELKAIQIDCDSSEDGFLVFSSKVKDVKIEMKDEEYGENILEVHFDEDNNCDDQSFEIKEENLEKLLGCDDESSHQPEKVNKHRKGTKRKSKENCKFKSKTVQLGYIEKTYISEEDCALERSQRAAGAGYQAAAYRCELCVKPFQFRDTYERHMLKHGESAGDFECNVCKQRMASEKKLKSHQKYHQIRYKCVKCEFTVCTRLDVRRHHAQAHEAQPPALACSSCPKVFSGKERLKKHQRWHRAAAARVTCEHCRKTYVSKRVLLVHIATVHTDQPAGARHKPHACAACGKTFRAPSYLKKHMLTHSDKKEFYCVECDRAFKSENSLQTHLKTTKLHIVNDRELRFPCEHCERRFSVRRDVRRHTDSVHLHVRPHGCARCHKVRGLRELGILDRQAYVSKWSLDEHMRLAHEGYRRPLKHPCPMCDKVFTRTQILKSHIRTHTGERPYACAAPGCGAAFGQRSVLRTHERLVHLRLGRDGRQRT